MYAAADVMAMFMFGRYLFSFMANHTSIFIMRISFEDFDAKYFAGCWKIMQTNSCHDSGGVNRKKKLPFKKVYVHSVDRTRRHSFHVQR